MTKNFTKSDYTFKESFRFSRKVTEIYSAIMGPQYAIGLSSDTTRLKQRMTKQIDKELLEHNYMQDPLADKKLELAALRVADFLSTRSTRPYNYRKDTSKAKMVGGNIALGWNAIYMKFNYGRLMVPDYSTETKEDYKNGFNEIFENIREKSDTQLLDDEIKEMSDYLLKKMSTKGVVFSVEKPLRKVFPKCTESAIEEFESTRSPLDKNVELLQRNPLHEKVGHEKAGLSPKNPKLVEQLTKDSKSPNDGRK